MSKKTETTKFDEAIEIVGLCYHNYRDSMTKNDRAKVEKVFKEFYQLKKGLPYYEQI